MLVEGAVVELFLALLLADTPWPWVALGLHVYGLLWLLALHASWVTRPHLITDRELRLRDGAFVEIVIQHAAIRSTRLVRQQGWGRSGLQVDDNGVATLAHGDTTVEVTLHPDSATRVSGPRAKTFIAARFTVDDPERFRAAVDDALAGFSADQRPRGCRRSGPFRRPSRKYLVTGGTGCDTCTASLLPRLDAVHRVPL